MTLKALDIIKHEVGPGNIAIESDFVGVQPPNYPINTIFLFTSGPHEAVMLVALKPEALLHGEDLKERLRHLATVPNWVPGFQPGATWSPDGRTIAVSLQRFGKQSFVLCAVSVSDGGK